MRIGIDMKVLSKDKLAGIGLFAKKVVNYIGVSDKENEFFLYSNKELKQLSEVPDNCTVRIVPGRFGSITEFFKWHRTIKEDKLDIFWGIEHILPRKVKGVRYVLTIHDLAFLTHPEWGDFTNIILQKLLLKGSVKRAEKILTVSENSKRDIISILNVDEKKIHVTYNPFVSEKRMYDTELSIDEIREKYGILEKYFLFVSTIEPRKNITNLVKAFNLVAEHSNDLSLVLVGKLGWKYASILEEIDKSPYKNRIIMPGYITEQEKQVLFENCVGFVFPSHYEGFGIPILEAMSFGTVVITANNSSLPEVGGDAAIYVKNENDPVEIANRMDDCRKLSVAEKQIYINKGLEQIKNFTDDKTIGKMFELITK